MKTLYESLLDDFDTLSKGLNPRNEVIYFLEQNYRLDTGGQFIVSQDLDKDGLYTVDATGLVTVTNKNLKELTNGLFHFNSVVGFICFGCKKLKTLKGGPKICHSGSFSCQGCDSLTNLKYSPEIVECGFNCSYCTSLTSLEGMPKEVGEYFWCELCKKLTSLKHSPRKVKEFICDNCHELKNLDGAPSKVRGIFSCQKCGAKFTKDDVKKVSNVGGTIFV